jgi:hypothetical protein
MKVTLRIPTAEQYAFVEVEMELRGVDDAKDVRVLYDEFTALFKDSGGLNQMEWARVKDGYIWTKTITPEDYEALSSYQKSVINEIKNAFRNNNK